MNVPEINDFDSSTGSDKITTPNTMSTTTLHAMVKPKINVDSENPTPRLRMMFSVDSKPVVVAISIDIFIFLLIKSKLNSFLI